MAKFITLINYTQEGIEEFEGIPDRLEKAEALAEEMGGELEEFYLTLGEYDAVSITEVPDAKSHTAGVVTLSKAGTIETESLRAFDEEEIEEIIEAVPD
jgi:uncharacterized protein with GYD domain